MSALICLFTSSFYVYGCAMSWCVLHLQESIIFCYAVAFREPYLVGFNSISSGRWKREATASLYSGSKPPSLWNGALN